MEAFTAGRERPPNLLLDTRSLYGAVDVMVECPSLLLYLTMSIPSFEVGTRHSMDAAHARRLKAKAPYLQQLTREISDSSNTGQPGPETPPAEATTDPAHQLRLQRTVCSRKRVFSAFWRCSSLGRLAVFPVK